MWPSRPFSPVVTAALCRRTASAALCWASSAAASRRHLGVMTEGVAAVGEQRRWRATSHGQTGQRPMLWSMRVVVLSSAPSCELERPPLAPPPPPTGVDLPNDRVDLTTEQITHCERRSILDRAEEPPE